MLNSFWRLCLIAAHSLLLLPARAADWPQFLGPNRNGASPEKLPAAGWPKEGPRLLWKTPVGSGFSGPVVSAEKLILFHRRADREVLECFEARDGKALWKGDYPTGYVDDFGFDNGPRSTPTIAAGHVFSFGADGKLTAWDLGTGAQLWQVDTRSVLRSRKGFFGLVCSPLVESNLVLVSIGGEKNAGIAAFDVGSGALKWKATDHEAGYSSPSAATIDGVRYAFFLTREGLVALNPASGQIYFQFPWRARMHASVNAATPLVVGNLVFLSASYQTGALLGAVRNGKWEKVWSADDVLSNHYATSVHYGGYLYGYDGRQEEGPRLRCVELKTGKVQWTVERFGAGTLLETGGELLLLTEKGELVRAAASPQRYQEKGRAQILGGEVRAYPALADGLYYARNGRELICVDLGR